MHITYPKTTQPHSVHRYLMLDRSGSMYSNQQDLILAVTSYIEKCSNEDIFNITFFSSRQDFDNYLSMSKNQALNTILKYQVGGLTCFADPLKSLTDHVLKTDNNTLVLFTDGSPTQYSQSEEINLCVKELTRMSNNIKRFDIIGFGQYYSETFLSGISGEVMGTLVHHTNINTLTDKMESLVTGISPSFETQNSDKYKVKSINGVASLVFGNTVQLNGMSEEVITFNSLDEVTEDQQYIVAQALYRAGKNSDAIEVLTDKRLLDLMSATFTSDEKENVLSELINCVNDKSSRMTQGKVLAGYKPTENSPCVMSLLEILSTTNSTFYPYSDKVPSYTSRGAKVDTSQEIFQTDSQMVGYFKNLKFTKGRLNVNVPSRQEGWVMLTAKTAKRVGLDKKQPCTKHKEFSIIHDGFLNVKTIHANLTKSTFDTIHKLGYDVTSIAKDDYIIHFPDSIFNLSFLNSKKDKEALHDYCMLALNEVKLSAEQKVINFLIKENSEEKGIYRKLTPDQITVLKENGVNFNRNYVGVSDSKPEYTDIIRVKTVETKIAGLSSLPTVPVVRKKVGTYTLSQQFIADALTKYENSGTLTVDLIGVKESLTETRRTMWSIVNIVFARGETFDTLGEDGKTTYNGYDFTIKAVYKDKRV